MWYQRSSSTLKTSFYFGRVKDALGRYSDRIGLRCEAYDAGVVLFLRYLTRNIEMDKPNICGRWIIDINGKEYEYKHKITPVCVKRTVSDCGYGQPLFFNFRQTDQSGNLINDPNTDNFIPITDSHKSIPNSNRLIYSFTRRNSKWTLFYRDDHWTIGPNYLSSWILEMQ